MADNAQLITAQELQQIFAIPRGINDSRVLLYQAMRDNYKELEPLGHNLWIKPINYIANLIIILDHQSRYFNKLAIAELIVFINHIPRFDVDDLDKSIASWSEYLSKDYSKHVNSNKDWEVEVNAKMAVDPLYLQSRIDNILHYYMITLRFALAQRIILESKNNRPQEYVAHSHPIYKLYGSEDIRAGAIGDGRDLQKVNKSLISSNDISGLLIKLKTVYMKAAYLQLIQTLSQLAEKKSYKSITFRQDELKEVLAQIKQLSDDTYKQLKIEDELISKMCCNIIKIIDPSIDEEKTMESLSLDLGSYPSYNYSIINRSYN